VGMAQPPQAAAQRPARPAPRAQRAAPLAAAELAACARVHAARRRRLQRALHIDSAEGG